MTALIKNSINQLGAKTKLDKALSDFQSILTPEQNARFLAARTHAISSPPGVQDVMNLTAEIDLKTREKRCGARRCFGPRFTMILESVQQYASLGDIIIGSSQNIIACVNFSTYLEQVSQLFMRVGLSAPRYHGMASLFPQSEPLRALIAQYFVTVVRICHKTVHLCQQPLIRQVKAFITDCDLAEYESQFTNNTAAIKEQLQLEKMKSASALYSKVRSFSALEKQRYALKDQLQILDQCSTHPYQAAWRRIKKQGDATWIYDQIEYEAWLQPTKSSSLLFRGKLGSGKSVQMANIVDDLNLNHSKYKTAYFFCCSDDLASLDHRTILGCLARQVLLLVLSDARTIISEDLHTSLNSNDMIGVLRLALSHAGRTFIVLDGIDACDRDDRKQVLQALSNLQETCQLSICASLSLEASLEIDRDMESLFRRSYLTLPDERPELSSYIKERLLSKLRDESLSISDENLVLEIRDALQAGAQGMFLWVHLQIESICIEKSDHAIREALLHLPQDLHQTFKRILNQYRSFASDYQVPLLKVLTAALRPLSLGEMREILSLAPGDPKMPRAKKVNDIQAVLRCCGSLVTLDEERLTLHLVHQSFKQFLLGDTIEKRDTSSLSIPFGKRAAEQEMGARIVTYLSWEGFDSRLSTTITPTLLADDIPRKIVDSSSSMLKAVRYMAIDLLEKQTPNTSIDVGKVLAAESMLFKRKTYEFHFLQYARAYWLHHTKTAYDYPARVFHLFSKLLKQPHLVENSFLWKDLLDYPEARSNSYVWAV
ncbi:uncharacterized protein F4822DRAFT_46817 [Hypoxylon trugodes]|uniref:uncharacterized protein n=1 Tax=Hypoxylon trugodes TaxID=326681 RepID=UPI00218E0C5F|nr:uncharacterized protein F4822DRAFT_46817 [Hypoxylon trugodes]KAI1394393.1 hypothetical protein F4822DRAFT_46817 [Hypoxylon trugodes]